MLSTYNFYRKNKLTISWVILISFILFIVFNFSTSTTNAQQTTGQIKVSCAPNKRVVQRNENVTFTATVENATERIRYSWSGTKIQSVDSPRVTTSYGSLGEKKATVTIVTGTTRIRTECSVIVSTNVSIQTQAGGQQGGNNPLQNLGGLQQMLGGGNNPLGGLTGGQQGGNNPLGNIMQQGGSLLGGGAGQTGTNQIAQTTESLNPSQRQEIARNNARQNNPARNSGNSLQQSNQATNRTFEQESKSCEQQNQSSGSNNPADSVKEELSKSIEEEAQSMTQQMVPTNPIPIVDPIKNMRENIHLITAKEIGASGSQEPSLDRVAHCKVDAMLKRALENSKNFLYKGDNNNPIFIVNYNNYFIDIHDKSKEDFLNEFMNSKNSCNPEEDKNIAIAIAKQSDNILKESANKSCKVQEGEDDKYDLTKLENFLNFSNPTENLGLRNVQAEQDLNRYITSNLLEKSYETEIALGFKNMKDKDENIEEPAQVYLPQILNEFNISARFTTLDEEGETSEFLSEYLEKVIVNPNQQNNFENPSGRQSNLSPTT